MNKIILIKSLKTICSDKEFVMLVKNEAYKKDGENWSFDHWKRFETERNIHDKKKSSTLLDKIHHEIDIKHREREDCELIFDNEAITRVAEIPERMINVEIQVADYVKYLSSTITFFDNPLYRILYLMKEITPLTYKI